jgi:alkanesulfonate monooxygenase SsuD/methylene tetrahydromethanopterin reductase-like flavin-dependent oxidoreductase (luciferase family)
MVDFDPTTAPVGRLARLGVVLDAHEPIDRVRGHAVLCDRAGIDAVWIAARGHLDDPARWTDTTATLDAVAAVLGRARLGLLLPPDSIVPALAHEVLFGAAPSSGSGTRPIRRGALLADLRDTGALFRELDDIVLAGWRFPDLETAADEVRAEAAEAGRDPTSLGVGALLTVSIGRTQAEAEARAGMDPLFGRLGHPAETGIFGTLEECQDRVIALAHAGIVDLRCILPATDDLHDVIAQLTAITIGTTDVLVPGSLRSEPPPPPPGWGARAGVPVAPQISGGSRRR